MLTKVQKWGNSQGLRLAKSILEDARIEVGDQVDVGVRDGVIVVAPVLRMRGKYRLEDLVSRIPADHHSTDVDWGKPVGRETW